MAFFASSVDDSRVVDAVIATADTSLRVTSCAKNTVTDMSRREVRCASNNEVLNELDETYRRERDGNRRRCS